MISKKDILYFELSSQDFSGYQNHLRFFLNFLNFSTKSLNHSFAYISKHGSLISSLSIKENIFLESFPVNLTSSKESQLFDFLNKTGNDSLISLFNKIPYNQEDIKSLSETDIKRITIIKEVLRSTKYLILEEPEFNLDYDSIFLLNKILKHEALFNNKIIIMSTRDVNQWSNLFNKKITKVDEHYEIKPFLEQKKNQTPDGVLSFHNFENYQKSTNKKAA